MHGFGGSVVFSARNDTGPYKVSLADSQRITAVVTVFVRTSIAKMLASLVPRSTRSWKPNDINLRCCCRGPCGLVSGHIGHLYPAV